jgi:hypothetical protein
MFHYHDEEISVPAAPRRACSFTFPRDGRFKALIDWETLEPIRLQKTIPWCMKQYERIFDTTRVPGKDMDIVMHYENDPNRYAAVSRKGIWYNPTHPTARANTCSQRSTWRVQIQRATPRAHSVQCT